MSLEAPLNNIYPGICKEMFPKLCWDQNTAAYDLHLNQNYLFYID